MSDPSIVEKSIAALAAEPGVALVACLFDAPDKFDPDDLMGKRLAAIGRGAAAQGKTALLFTNLAAPVTAEGRSAEAAAGVIYSGAGLDRGISAMAAATRWWRRRGEIGNRGMVSVLRPLDPVRPRGEFATLAYLAKYGVPVVPQQLTASAEEAAAAAEAIGAPVALKIASAQIAHKSDIGGVALGVDPAAVSAAYDYMMARVGKAAPDAQVDGVLVAPMREEALELFVGILRDPVWGCAISVGLGGVFVETLGDTALRLAPVTQAEVLEMLAELRGTALLDGARGRPPIDRAAVARAVVAITEAALALGPDLVSLEINPLAAWPDRVEALDALAVWQE
jgi:acyl-CoA synthetase (NDP forming)